MEDHFIEGVGVWGRSKMIEIGVPEDVVDMYVEMISHELRDDQHKLSLKLYCADYYKAYSRWCVTARKPGPSRSSSPRSGSPKQKSRPSSPKRG